MFGANNSGNFFAIYINSRTVVKKRNDDEEQYEYGKHKDKYGTGK